MNIKLSRRQTIIYILMVLVAMLMLSIWPCRFIHRNINVKSDEVFLEEAEPANAENNIAQVFVADGEELESVNLYICNDMAGETLNFTIYDGNLKQLVSKTFTVPDDASLPGMVNIPVDWELEKGIAYIYTVHGQSCDLVVGLEAKDPVKSITVGGTNYAGTEYADKDVIINFNYIKEFTAWQIVLIDLFVLLIFAGVLVLINHVTKAGRLLSISRELTDGKWHEDFVSVQRLLQCTLLPLVWLGAIIVLYMIFPLGMFRTELSSILFYYFGVLLLALLITYLISYKRNDNKELMSIRYFIENHQKWLIVVAIGHIFWYCYEYMNGLYEIHHMYAARRVLIWVLVCLIFTYDKKELYNIINVVWLIIGSVIGYFHAKPYVGSGEDELLYKLNAYIIVFAGLVLINMIRTIIRLIKKEIRPRKFDLLNTIIMIVFAVVIIAFANTRWWPAYLVVLCALISFRLAFWKDAAAYLNYLCDGILFNFLMMVLYSLLHRPYYRYVYYRYNMTYFTVTMTATHISLIVCAALVKFIVNYSKTDDKRKLIPSMLIFGAAACYQVYTLARTSFLCIGVTGLITIIAVIILEFKKGNRCKRTIESLVLMVLSVLIMFPISFTATRIVPALADDPVIFDYEYVDETMYKGTPTDDYGFMDISRFFEVFGSKIFHVGRTRTSVDSYSLPEDYFRPTLVQVLAEADDIITDTSVSSETLTEEASQSLEETEATSAEEVTTEIHTESESEDPYAFLENSPFTKEEWLHFIEMRDEYDYLTDEEYWLWINGELDVKTRIDVSNGRMDIYRSYFEQLNLWGHDEMGAILEDGSEAAHAHSIYLQMLFDFGIIPGAYLILVFVYMGIISLFRLIKYRKENEYLWLTPVIMLGFLSAGIVEWVFHACNPFGLAAMMAILPMIYKVTDDEKSIEL